MPTPAELAAAQAIIDAATEEGKEKVTFDEKQQAKVTELIKKERSEAARELRAQYATEKAEKEALAVELATAKEALAKAKTPTAKAEAAGDLEALKAQIEEMKAASQLSKAELDRVAAAAAQKAKEAADARADISNYKRESAVLDAASKVGFYDVKDVVKMTMDSVKFDEASGTYYAVNEAGQPRLNAAMEPMSLDEFFTDYAAKKPYFVRSDVKGGTGAAGAHRSGLNGRVKYEYTQVFGPKADGALALNLIKNNKQEYARLRAQAVEAGMLSA